jgi:DNA-binding NarL/FixJ family response regulator
MVLESVLRVVLADDHQVVRRGIRDFLETEGDIVVVAEAEDGQQAIKLIEHHSPDVAVLDIRMPECSGLEVVRWVRERGLPVGLLILTAYADDPCLRAAVKEGVDGYMLKTADAEDIVRAVRAVHAGKTALDPRVVGSLMQVMATASEAQTRLEELTSRQLAVLRGAAQGLSNEAIGVRLGISAGTVQGHLRKVYLKLHVRNRTEAVMKAVQLGLIESLVKQ